MEVTTTTTTRNPTYYEKGKDTIYTSVGNVSGLRDEFKFIRDPEKLLIQYENLIKAVDKEILEEFPMYFAGYADKQDLYTTIKETFVNLVLEFDPYYDDPRYERGIDFSGYIIHNLRARIREGYAKRKGKKDLFTSPLMNNTSLSDGDLFTYLMYANKRHVLPKGTKAEGVLVSYNDSDSEMDTSAQDLMEDLAEAVHLTDLDKLILTCFFNGIYSSSQVDKVVQQLEPGKYSSYSVYSEIKELKDVIYLNYKDRKIFKKSKFKKDKDSDEDKS